jgi:FtsP/CotA-like multicopper oxidase with cupredoxin domain
VLLAYAGAAALVGFHAITGRDAARKLSAPLHILRDGTMALPAVLVAVLAALILLRTAPRRWSWADAAVAEMAAAVALATATPVHALLFGDGLRGPVLRDTLADATIAALGTGLAAFSIPALPALRRLAGSVVRQRRQLIVAATVLALAAIGLPTLPASPAQAKSDDPVEACTSGTATPDRAFDVSAIDVDIPLNAFGDHDPGGHMYVLDSQMSAVRDQERTRKVTPGLRDDPIQPLLIRANEGECVRINFTNRSKAGPVGVHLDGLSFAIGSSGDAIGDNPASDAAPGEKRTYWFHAPDDVTAEGTHYMRPGPGNRALVGHGLFGGLIVEPKGSTWWQPGDTTKPLVSGWEAIIVPGGADATCTPANKRCSFREEVLMHHEIGNDNERLKDKFNRDLPQVDDTTGSYRPGAFALNYRSEPFRNRLLTAPKEKSHSYSSYTFGEPSTPMPRGYLGDPTKIRIVHAGGEKFHVYHLHGGGDRWRANPTADPTNNYSVTGLDKSPKVETPSVRLDSQSIGPGESFDLDIEGGAGGVQQSVGDFLFHCHIAKHYVSGMWSVWRVYNTLQPDLAPLPDKAYQPPAPVDSAALVGRTMPDGTVLTKDNIDAWIRQQLPEAGVAGTQDASVWDWTVKDAGTDKALYLGEPVDKTEFPDSPRGITGQPNLFAGDRVVDNRPVLWFDPATGRPAYPMLRPHIGKRPPFSGSGHTGTPYLGNTANVGPSANQVGINAWAGRKDGLCPSTSPTRTYNVVAVGTPVQRSKLVTDPEGKLFTLAKDKDALLAGARDAEPLAIRANQGDCVAVTLTNEIPDAQAFDGWSKSTMHIHHVQFDVQGSDGVSAGFAYEHSVRPYLAEDPKLVAQAFAGDTVLSLASVAKFDRRDASGARSHPYISVGEGTDGIETVQVASLDLAANTVTLTAPLAKSHGAGEYAGTEFIQYRWYPDVVLDNIFWHDHVDGIHGWGHGLVGQLIVEPEGSTYHDPKTGAQVDSGTQVDIHTNNPLVPGVVDGSFREQVLWTINDNDKSDYSTLNLKSEPATDRLDEANRYSSYKYGDPKTPLPRLYANDPLVIRAVAVSPTVDTLKVQGGRTTVEARYTDEHGQEATILDTIHAGVSEKQTLIFNSKDSPMRPGDYLYGSGIDFRAKQGAWGIIRILPGMVDDLKPLPGTVTPAASYAVPTVTGAAPPAAGGPGNPCPAGAPSRRFAVTAADLPSGNLVRQAFVPDADLAAVQSGKLKPDPLVLHAVAGECVTVTVTNTRSAPVSFAVGKLDRDVASSGVNVGFNPQQNVPPKGKRDYVYFASSPRIGTATIADLASDKGAKSGLYGAITIAPAGVTGPTTFTDPVTGAPRDTGSQVIAHVPGGRTPDYRDATVIFADDDAAMGQDFMPYPTNAVAGKSMINYRVAKPGDGPTAFRTLTGAAQLTSYAGDPMVIHAVGAPGSEQAHVLSLGGLRWHADANIRNGDSVEAEALGPGESIDAWIEGGSGGEAHAAGDYFLGDLRRPFTQAGMWGVIRVLPPGATGCAIRRLNGAC